MCYILNMVLMMLKDENEGQYMVYIVFSYDEGLIVMCFLCGNGFGVKMDEQLKMILIGMWEVLCSGNDVVILIFGIIIEMVIEVVEELQKEGFFVCVVNVCFIKLIDEKMMKSILKEGLLILIIEEVVLEGGFGSLILEFVYD